MATSLTRFSTALQKLEGDDPTQFDQETERQELHYNYLQLLCFLVGAQYTNGIAGRGTGKSEGVLAMRLLRLLKVMHRSSIVAIGTTYIQLLTQTLPAVFKGMHKLGYERDQDYWVGRLPDKKAGIILPHNTPLDAQHTIFMRNPGTNKVSGLRLVGQDNPGTANGLSVNALIGDEARFLNKRKLDNDILAINRGDEHLFGEFAEHHSICLTTDRPMRGEAEWLKDAREDSLRPEHQKALELILATQLELYKERQALAARPSRNAARMKRIEGHEYRLNLLRKGLVHVAEASSFANVHVLGLDYFKKLYREMPPSIFKTRILNEETDGSDLYYPDFKSDRHYYDAVNYQDIDIIKAFDRVSFNDCRKDADIDPKQRLTIGMDYGANFNCMVVGQRWSRLHPMNNTGYDEVRYLKAFHVAKPGKVQHVVKQFTEYYRYHYNKEVMYVYDPTAIDTDGKDTMTYASEVIKALKAAGWKVKTKYLRKVPGHDARYMAWGIALSETDERFARQRFNRENTKVAVTCMQNAKTRHTEKGFKKDKLDERNDDIDQSTTTHYTDAADTLFWYLNFVEPNQLDLLPPMFSSQ